MPEADAGGVKTIFQLIEERKDETQLPPARAIESEVIVVGGKQAGKTSLINTFMNKVDAPKPTTALDYKYARYSPKDGQSAIVANIWELAGDTQLAQLLDVVLVPQRLARSQVVIVVDLSKPGEVLKTVKYWTEAIRARVEVCTGRPAPVDDSAEVRPVGIPVSIVASKWDVFEEKSQASTEYLQIMAKTLRYFAHANGTALLYTSDKDKVLLGVLRRLISHHAFDREEVTAFQPEYTKGVVVPAGRDNLTSIGSPPGLEGATSRQRLSDAWTRTFEELFPPPEQKGDQPNRKKHVVDSDAYAEEAVDSMRAQKLKELSQRAARLKAEQAAAASGAAAAAAQAAGAR
mmetsp:Transcript_10803/g.26215  ORF Transcript_10803/g.26215 Transcript_10803/m.26215 type:complete len:347 (-) Transcript_10803:314-1354(-)